MHDRLPLGNWFFDQNAVAQRIDRDGLFGQSGGAIQNPRKEGDIKVHSFLAATKTTVPNQSINQSIHPRAYVRTEGAYFRRIDL